MSHTHTRRFILAAAAITSLAATLTAAAGFGPLNPPAGAITSTAKPLAEIEPRTVINATNTPGDADSTYKITTPGSYYLTGNMVAQLGKSGIEITSSGVTIDLNGFQITGFGALAAISTSSTTIERIVIRNGQITFCSAGIALPSIPGVSVERVNVDNTAGDGIAVGGSSRVERCIVRNNGGSGIVADRGCKITDCVAGENDLNGISGGNGGSVTDCSAYANGARGISIGVAGVAHGCSSYDNANQGISASTGAVVQSCAVYGNGSIGIDANQGCTVADSIAYNSGSNGISVWHGSVVTGCSSYENSGCGITAPQSSTISNCTTSHNSEDGIRVFISCLVLNNTCFSDGVNNGNGAGIHATSADNRIEGNLCTGADRGIDIDVGGNFIARNTCSGNTTNWDVVAGNKCLVILGVNSGAILGNAGGVSPGSTDPNANYTH